MSPPPQGTQSVLDLLASYSSTSTADHPSPTARFASARLERQQSRAARLERQQEAAQGASRDPDAPAIAGEAAEEDDSVAEGSVAEAGGGVPRLRVKAPTSAGGLTYSPTIPGTPDPSLASLSGSAHDSPAGSSMAGDLASSPVWSASPTAAAAGGKDTKHKSIEIADIPPFKGLPSRPTSPAGSQAAQMVKSRLAEKLKAQHQAAEVARGQTPPPSAAQAQPQPITAASAAGPVSTTFINSHEKFVVASSPAAAALPASPALVPIPLSSQRSADEPETASAPATATVQPDDTAAAGIEQSDSPTEQPAPASGFHEWHAMSPITERTEQSSIFTRGTGSVHVPSTPALGSIRSSIRSFALSSRLGAPSSTASSISSLGQLGQQESAANVTPTRPPRSELRQRENSSPTRKPSPELARRAALFTASAVPNSKAAPVVYSAAAPPIGAASASNIFGSSASASVGAPAPAAATATRPEPAAPVVDEVEARYVPAGWDALRRETEQELSALKSDSATRPVPRLTSPVPAAPLRAPSSPSVIFSERLQSDAGVAPAPLSPDDPPAPPNAIVYEGPLLVTAPPSPAALSKWSSHYCVLTSATLEARPTDRSGSQRGAVVMLYIADCIAVRAVDDPAPVPGGLRAFEVHIVAGGTKRFAADSRLGRMNWILALEKVIPRSGRSAWSSSSPSPTSFTFSDRSPREVQQRQQQCGAGGLVDQTREHIRLQTGVNLADTALFASPSQLSSDPNHAPVTVSYAFPPRARSDSTRSLARPRVNASRADHYTSPSAERAERYQDRFPAESFRSAHSRAHSETSLGRGLGLGQAQPAPPSHSLRTGVTADESSVFGAGGAAFPRLLPIYGVNDLFGHLHRQHTAQTGAQVPVSVSVGAASPRKALPRLPSTHTPWQSEPRAAPASREERIKPPENAALPPTMPLPDHIRSDLSAIADVISGALAASARSPGPHALATDIYFLLKSVLTKLKLVGFKGTHRWAEALLLPLIDRLIPASSSAREPSMIHGALVETLAVVRSILSYPSQQHARPPYTQLISPGKPVDADQATQTTRGLVHDPDEALAWKEQRRSYQTEASEADRQLRAREAPSPAWNRRVAEVRAAGRKLEGRRDPYGPSTATATATRSDSLASGSRRPSPPKAHLRQQQQKVPPPTGSRPRRQKLFPQEVSSEDELDPAPVADRADKLHPLDRRPLPVPQHSRASSEASSARTAKAREGSQPGSAGITNERHLPDAQRLAANQGWSEPPLSGASTLRADRGAGGTASGWQHAAPSTSAETARVPDDMRALMGDIRAVIDAQHALLAENSSQRQQLNELMNWMSQAMHTSVEKQDSHFAQIAQQAADLKDYLGQTFPHVLAAKLTGEDFDEADGEEGGDGDEEGGQQEPTTDPTEGGAVEGAEGEAEAGGAAGLASGAGRVRLGGFAQVEDGMLAKAKLKKTKSGRFGGLKGPRALRIWGAPPGGASRPSQWATAIASAPPTKQPGQTDEEYDAAVAAHIAAHEKVAHQPLIDAIRTDEGLARTLETLAQGKDDIDAGAMAVAVFEILQSMRDIHRRQAKREADEAEDKLKHGGLSRHEVALLELKKAELAKLEQLTEAENTTTTKLDHLVAEFNRKEDAFKASLTRIEGELMEGKGKKTEMDPELVQEGKRLLEGVKNGVDGHVKDFRGQITGEVQRMFKEVGKLRDEKKNLQTEIAELMAFQARQGGGGGRHGGAPTTPITASPTPLPTPDASAKPGLAPSGWFGPR